MSSSLKISAPSIFVFLALTLLCTAAFSQDVQPASINPELAELSKAVVKLFKERNFTEALPLAEKQLKLAEAENPPNLRELEIALSNLAETRWALGRYEAAEPLFRRAVKASETRHGVSHPLNITLLMRTGWIYHSLSRPQDAENYFKRALAIGEQQSNPSNSIKTNAIYALGAMWEKQGKANFSIPYFKQWLEIQSQNKDIDSTNFRRVLGECVCVMKASSFKNEVAEIEQRYGKTRPLPANKIGVSGGVLQGTAIKKVQPPYPDSAKARRTQGAVEVQVEINEQGDVIDAYALCGPDLLRDVSLAAARQWKFKPTTLEGKPMQVMGVLTFNFTMQ